MMDPYAQQDVIERVNDLIVDDRPMAAVTFLIESYGLLLDDVAAAIEDEPHA